MCKRTDYPMKEGSKIGEYSCERCGFEVKLDRVTYLKFLKGLIKAKDVHYSLTKDDIMCCPTCYKRKVKDSSNYKCKACGVKLSKPTLYCNKHKSPQSRLRVEKREANENRDVDEDRPVKDDLMDNHYYQGG